MQVTCVTLEEIANDAVTDMCVTQIQQVTMKEITPQSERIEKLLKLNLMYRKIVKTKIFKC